MTFPFYPQYDSMDCGPACLCMIAKFYKRELPLDWVREKAQIGKQGVNLLGISEAAEEAGFRTRAVQLSIESLLNEATLPAILHWEQKHFVVLYKTGKRKFHIADPAKGKRHLDKNEFAAAWLSDRQSEIEKGVVLVLEPSPEFYSQDEFEEKERNKSGFRNVFKYLLPYRKLLVQLFIGLLTGSLLQLILPFLTQSIVDSGIQNRNLHFIYLVLLAQSALFIGRMMVDFIRSWILLHISSRINIAILTDFLRKLLRLPLHFFDSRHTGDILQRMNDHSRIESFLTGSSLSVLFSLINLLVFSFVLMIYNSGIFIVFLVATIIYGGWVLLFLKKIRNLDHKKFAWSSKEQAITLQLIQGMTEIRLNGAERSMRWDWERIKAKLFRINMQGLALRQWQQAGAFFINEGKNIFISFLSAKAVIDGSMTLGSMLAVQYIIGQLNSPIEQMIEFIQSLQRAKISLERLNEVHEQEDEETPGLHSEIPFSQVPFIALHKIDFTYPGAGNERVLSQFDLQIPTGKTTAIVGESGSGKTTILKLLLRIHEPQKGEILLGKVPFKHISHRRWRQECGVVMQESYIFSDTIAKNIAVGQERIDREKLIRACEISRSFEFINDLPLHFNTQIGTGGLGISTGQKQRLMIARAIYRDPQIVLFDEATNNLDTYNEQLIMEALNEFFKGRTVIIVAHRLSTVKKADQIIVLNKGKVVEKGSHEELLKRKGEYFTLVSSQMEKEIFN